MTRTAVATLAVVVTTAGAVIGYASHPHRAAAVVLAALVLTTLAGTVVFLPARRPPMPRSDQHAALADMPSEQVARNKLAARALSRVQMSKTVMLFLLGSLGLTPAGAAVLRWLGQPFTGSHATQFIVGVAFVVLVRVMVTLLLSAVLPMASLRRQLPQASRGQLVAFQVVASAALSILVGVWLIGAYGLARLWPDWWWLGLSCLMAALTVAKPLARRWVARVRRFTPLEDEQLRERLQDLARRAGLEIKQVYVSRSGRGGLSGASVAGNGKWVEISKNLLSVPPEEIEAIVAHELAHVKYRDTVWRLFLTAVAAASLPCLLYLADGWEWLLALPGVSGVFDPAALGLLAMLLLVAGALNNVHSLLMARRKEAFADWYGLRLTNDPVAVENVMRRLLVINEYDPNPSRVMQVLSGTHPTLAERIAIARSFARAHPRQPVQDDQLVTTDSQERE